MSWIDKILPAGVRPAGRAASERRSSVPEGVWKKCAKCDAVLYGPELEKCFEVCPKCDHHMRLSARTRLDIFLDPEDREELATDVEPVDRLKFKDLKKYKDRLSAAQKSTGERDALLVMQGRLKGLPVVTAAFEFGFHGGSMGYAVGEKFARGAQRALEQRIPLICFSATGGARMQEALISLMQMAKTSAILERLKQAGVPYISVMTDPVYGGVSASLALLGDINIAEPNARAGFAGPNIIEQTIRQKLPPGFQRSEFLLDKGAIDLILHRRDMRGTLARLLASLTHQASPGPDAPAAPSADTDASEATADDALVTDDGERRAGGTDRRTKDSAADTTGSSPSDRSSAESDSPTDD